mgnify:CR=1 FL=1
MAKKALPILYVKYYIKKSKMGQDFLDKLYNLYENFFFQLTQYKL